MHAAVSSDGDWGNRQTRRVLVPRQSRFESWVLSFRREMKTVFDRQNEQYRNRRRELRAREKAERGRSRQWLWLVAAVIVVLIVLWISGKILWKKG